MRREMTRNAQWTERRQDVQRDVLKGPGQSKKRGGGVWKTKSGCGWSWEEGGASVLRAVESQGAVEGPRQATRLCFSERSRATALSMARASLCISLQKRRPIRKCWPFAGPRNVADISSARFARAQPCLRLGPSSCARAVRRRDIRSTVACVRWAYKRSSSSHSAKLYETTDAMQRDPARSWAKQSSL